VRHELLHKYDPRGRFRDWRGSRDDEVLLAGPAGTGKSRAALERLHYLCKRVPGVKVLVVRKTQVSLASTVLDTWRKHVIPADVLGRVVMFHGGGPQDPPQYRYSNGSVVNLGGMDNATKIMSSEYDIVYVNEATELTEADWDMLNTRLRNGRLPYQQLLGDCNPQNPTHWLKLRCERGVCRMVHTQHEDNPVYFDRQGNPTKKGGAYMRRLDALVGVRKLRLRDGIWAAAEGVIFEEWDPYVNLVDPFEIPYDWPRWWVVDFGYTNPFVCQMWAEDPDGRLIMYREFYHTRKRVAEHARDILAAVTDSTGKWIEPDPMAIICDHDAEDRATLENELGMGTYPAIKMVTPGIQAAQGRLQVHGDGKPRMMLMRDCRVKRDPLLEEDKLPTCTAEEVEGYVWDTSGNKGPKEVPLKLNDHGCDCIRYLAAEHDLGARPRLRTF
jgi:phage terminase large subunit